MPLYLVWHEPERTIDCELWLALERVELRTGLMLVDSALTRSRLYHRIKRALPSGAALLVAPLAEAPKFKGMNPGALAWIRRRRDLEAKPGSRD